MQPNEHSTSPFPPDTGARLVSFVVGLVLIATGALKGLNWTVDPYSSGDLPAVPAVRAAIVDLEVALAVWLLSGSYPRAARAAAVCCFTLFLAVATKSALGRQESCGCLGNLIVSPWLMAAFDILVLGCLIGFEPRSRPIGRLRTGIALVLFLGVSLPLTLMISHAGRQSQLIVTPAVVDLGTIPSGTVARARFTVSNPGPSVVSITSITPNCSCVEVTLSTTTITGSESANGEIILDTKVRPNFGGALAIKVIGSNSEGRVVMTLYVRAVVQGAEN
jgi:hypothetical protein